jgi:hypothetical protein
MRARLTNKFALAADVDPVSGLCACIHQCQTTGAAAAVTEMTRLTSTGAFTTTGVALGRGTHIRAAEFAVHQVAFTRGCARSAVFVTAVYTMSSFRALGMLLAIAHSLVLVLTSRGRGRGCVKLK